MKRSRRDDVTTENAPAPAPPLPREHQSERDLLLSLHARLDEVVPYMRRHGEVLEILAEHDRAWFTVMNFLAERAIFDNDGNAAARIKAAIDARVRANGADPEPGDEPTRPGGD